MTMLKDNCNGMFEICKTKHYPRLDTVLFVENTIRKSEESLTRTGLYRKLGGRVMYSTINVILAYLFDSGKILFDKNKKIVWIYNPQAMAKFAKRKRLVLK
ncbi:MAG: hypothetical protein V1870_02490 [Candidatus Aenigmatarchaeota archaeon]